MRKLLLKCGLSPGDIVMMTAAVRDLHSQYPGKFATGVKTSCPEVWQNNPYLSSFSDDDPEVEVIECSYPLINRCDRTPYHSLHGFIEFLNDRLGLAIRPGAFKGDIHLSAQEKAWYSQVHEVTGKDIPFWIVAAGGKYDVTIKWWETERYQRVIDHFQGRIQFVQVGEYGHHHPRLQGVIDLRGQTNLRELIRLVYHADGIICPVTALMHLAAAVETKKGRSVRACVVVAGGREPPQWEAYRDHQFIHTVGALNCCQNGGCWKDRTFPLRDRDPRDRRDHLCVDVKGTLPRCMSMITPEEVARRVELYFNGGAFNFLSKRQRVAAKRGTAATIENDFDQQPLTLHSAGMACDKFIHGIPAYPGGYQGRGIVICGGGPKYFTSAWVCINMLRRTRCELPVELWHLGRKEMNRDMEELVRPLGVRCADASGMRRKYPFRILKGWELKPYALLHSTFKEVLLIDADNVPIENPEFLFESKEFRSAGAIFWPDYEMERTKSAGDIWHSLGIRRPREPEFESGQILIDKERCWRALNLTMWINENSDFFYKHVHGDKETFHLAWRKLGCRYRLVPHAVHGLEATMCQHDFAGRRIFQHRNTDKWDLFMRNRRVRDFRYEEQCLRFVKQLREQWDGGVSLLPVRGSTRAPKTLHKSSPPTIKAVMISCAERALTRRRTLDRLAKTDWGKDPVCVQMDSGEGDDRCQRQMDCAYEALKTGLGFGTDYILFLEDDLEFNVHLQHNLLNWNPLTERTVTLASLYNPGVRDLAWDARNNARVVGAKDIFGSQAFLISKETASYLVQNWRRVEGGQDIKISRLAGRLKRPIYYHAPSLVQHIGTKSVWGGKFHQASDYEREWKTGNEQRTWVGTNPLRSFAARRDTRRLETSR